MKVLRNFVFFGLISAISVACGGGNTTISANATDSSGTSGGSSGTGGSSGSGSVTYSTVTLNWTAPTTWTDSSPLALSDISGYKLYYGSSATNTPNSVNINNSTATQYTLKLPSGSYYFRMSTLVSNGIEGPLSPAVQKSL